MKDNNISLRILHTADIHLGIDQFAETQEGMHLEDPRYFVFSSVISKAIELEVDMFLIAGDLFDSNRVPEETIEFALNELGRLKCPVIILPGNHDCYDNNSIYSRVNFPAALNNVRVISNSHGEVLEYPALDTVVWGSALVDHSLNYRPLTGLPIDKEARWQIGLGHGYFFHDGMTPERSSPIFASDIRSSGLNYVALGHCHVFSDVSQGDVAAFYSGAPISLWGPQGRDGHVALVEFNGKRKADVIPTRILQP